MKKLIFLLSSVVSMYSFSQGSFKFVEETHDFGMVPEGDSIAYEFEFTNVGDRPITISNVQPSCGCTVPKFSKDPVQPGQNGKILAKYATKNRVGAFNKTLTITSDGVEVTKQIYFKGEVKAAPTADVVEPKTEAPVAPQEPQKDQPKKTSGSSASKSKSVNKKPVKPVQKGKPSTTNKK